MSRPLLILIVGLLVVSAAGFVVMSGPANRDHRPDSVATSPKGSMADDTAPTVGPATSEATRHHDRAPLPTEPPRPEDLVVEVRDHLGRLLADFPLVLASPAVGLSGIGLEYDVRTARDGRAVFRDVRERIDDDDDPWTITHDVCFEVLPSFPLDRAALAADVVRTTQPAFGSIEVLVTDRQDHPASRVDQVILGPVRHGEANDPSLAWHRRRFVLPERSLTLDKIPPLAFELPSHSRVRFDHVELGRTWAVRVRRDGTELEASPVDKGSTRDSQPGPSRHGEHVVLRVTPGSRIGSMVYRLLDETGTPLARQTVTVEIHRGWEPARKFTLPTSAHGEIEVARSDDAMSAAMLTVTLGARKASTALPKDLSPGPHHGGDLVLSPKSILVTGKALGPDGVPIRNLVVKAGQRVSHDSEFEVGGAVTAMARTDVSGRFSIPDEIPFTDFKVWAETPLRSEGVDAKRGDHVELACYQPSTPSIDVLVDPGVNWNGTDIQLRHAGRKAPASSTSSAVQDAARISVTMRPVRPGRYDLSWSFRGTKLGHRAGLQIDGSGRIAEIDLRGVLRRYELDLVPRTGKLPGRLTGLLSWRAAGASRWTHQQITGAPVFSAIGEPIEVRVVPNGYRAVTRVIPAGRHTLTLDKGFLVRFTLVTDGPLPERPYLFDPMPHLDGHSVGEAVEAPYFTETKREAFFRLPAGKLAVRWHLERRARGSAMGSSVLRRHTIPIEVKAVPGEQHFELKLPADALRRLVARPPF